MSKGQGIYPLQETVSTHHRHLLCWKSAFAGLLIAVMVFIVLTSFGAGVAGFTAEGLINHREGGLAFATGAGLFLGVSIVVALFSGSYFALRVSRFVTGRVGAAHGFVIASAFFLLMLMGLGNVIGGLASGFSGLAKVSGNGVADMAGNPMVQDTINQAFGTLKLKDDAKEVAQGLAMRLIQSDTKSAKNYLAYESGLAPAEVEAKITELKSQFDQAVQTVGLKSARAVGDIGFSFFVVFAVGLIAALMGGRIGANSNVDRPFASATAPTLKGFAPVGSERGSAVPYIFGWLLGVPVSILLLIAMFKAIF